jgi:hypothetical protein
MKTLVALTVSLALIVVVAGQVSGQYRYTDDKGASKVTQYKLDVPKDYRDAAVWVGPTGIGKPGLSEEARQTKLRDEAYRRIAEADGELARYAPTLDADDSALAGSQSSETSKAGRKKPLAVSCVAGHIKVMKSPGQWVTVGTCRAAPGATSGYTPITIDGEKAWNAKTGRRYQDEKAMADENRPK